MREVMPGYVKYYYKDGVLPTLIKSAFENYNMFILYSAEYCRQKRPKFYEQKSQIYLRFYSAINDQSKNLYHILPQVTMPTMKRHLKVD